MLILLYPHFYLYQAFSSFINHHLHVHIHPFSCLSTFISSFQVLSHFHVYSFLYFQHIFHKSNHFHVHSFSLPNLYTTFYLFILSAHFFYLYSHKTIQFNIAILVDNISPLECSFYSITWLTVFTFNFYYFSSFSFLLFIAESCLQFQPLFIFTSYIFSYLLSFQIHPFSFLTFFFFCICISQSIGLYPLLSCYVHHLTDNFHICALLFCPNIFPYYFNLFLISTFNDPHISFLNTFTFSCLPLLYFPDIHVWLIYFKFYIYRILFIFCLYQYYQLEPNISTFFVFSFFISISMFS